ncbi:MAG: hypothetical protein QM778_33185 [Myxococcales bacterium]
MAFGDRLKGAAGKLGEKWGKVDPFMGRILGGSAKDKKTLSPIAQYYGGSKEQGDAYRSQFQKGITGGQGNVDAGITRANDATDEASAGLNARSVASDYMLNRNLERGDEAGRGFDSSMTDYRAGRGAVLGAANKLETDADTLPDTYKQTSDRQFRLNQDRNTNAALALGSSGGAAGLRQALASSTQANADAAAQAEVTRAQEANELAQQQREARVDAATIRSNVGAQDQEAAGQYSGRQGQFVSEARANNEQGAGIDTNRATIRQNAANLQTQTGLSQQQEYLGALTGLEGAQLGANQKNEDQRQVDARNKYNDKWYFMSKFNQR